MAIQHCFRYSERVEVCQHCQHGRPPQEVQVQHDRPAGRSDPAAVHVLHPGAHEGGKVFTFRSQTRSVGVSQRLKSFSSRTIRRPFTPSFVFIFRSCLQTVIFWPQKITTGTRLNRTKCWLFCLTVKANLSCYEQDEAASLASVDEL